MALEFTKVPADISEALQKNAGVILTEFDPTKVIDDTYRATLKKNILFATNGGVNFTDTPEYTDGADGIDNMPSGTMEMMEISSREVKLSGTAKSVTSDAMLRLMASATKSTYKKDSVTDSGLEVFTPTDVLDISASTSMFKDLWYVCDYGTKGGFIAIYMQNTLNRDGFSIQTQNKDKGEFSFGFQAHYSADDINTVPYKIYKRSIAKTD